MTSRRWMALFWTQEIQYINFIYLCCCCCCFSFLSLFFFFFRVSRVTNWPALTRGINGENSFDWNRENVAKLSHFHLGEFLYYHLTFQRDIETMFEKFYHFICFLRLIQIYYFSHLDRSYLCRYSFLYTRYMFLILSYRALSLIYLFALINIYFCFVTIFEE